MLANGIGSVSSNGIGCLRAPGRLCGDSGELLLKTVETGMRGSGAARSGAARLRFAPAWLGALERFLGGRKRLAAGAHRRRGEWLRSARAPGGPVRLGSIRHGCGPPLRNTPNRLRVKDNATKSRPRDDDKTVGDIASATRGWPPDRIHLHTDAPEFLL